MAVIASEQAGYSPNDPFFESSLYFSNTWLSRIRIFGDGLPLEWARSQLRARPHYLILTRFVTDNSSISSRRNRTQGMNETPRVPWVCLAIHARIYSIYSGRSFETCVHVRESLLR